VVAGGEGPAADGRRPAPDLDRLDELVESVRRPGCRCGRAERSGEIPAGVGLSAYRIVQEALTNAVRHAAASTVHVRVATTPAAVEVAVLDDGAGARERDGRGLAACGSGRPLLGGTFDAGPRPGGGSGACPHPAERRRSMTIRVVLADDQVLVRGGFRMILEAREDLEVVGDGRRRRRGGVHWDSTARMWC